ncbi:MAG: histidine kinase, partial [Bacteroidota bacterium]|nr:histidine kinase [Bacteroidota bacterium]
YIYILKRSMLVRFCIAFLLIGCAELVSWVWYYIQEQKEITERNAITQQLAKDAELANLRQQLQPHFLFNSLNSISDLIGSKPEEARSMIQKLSDFLRGTLRKDEQKLVSLREEFELLQLYLDIEQVRFGQRLNTQITVDETCDDCLLPALILQPVVENAIKFGLYDTVGEVTIIIEAKNIRNQLGIIVKNPFDPQTTRHKQGTGFGVASVNRRLYLIFGQQNLLSTEVQENIFITQINIPQR